jgi:hypothetical protein
MSNGIQPYRTPVEIMQPRFTLPEMKDLATEVSKSGLFKMTPPQVLTLMMIAESEGIHPMQALMRWDIIDGRPAKKGVTVLSEFMAAGGAVVWGAMDDKVCEGTFSHPKHCPKGVTVRYTIEDAQRAQLTGRDNWKKNPADMLMWRVSVRGVRRALPGAIIGIYDPDDEAAAAAAPTEVEATARASLTAKLKARGNPAATHQPVADTVAELKAYQEAAKPPEPPKSPCREWIDDMIAETNREIAAKDPAIKAIVAHQVANALVKLAIEEGKTEEAALVNAAGKRDNRKVADEVNRLWTADESWVMSTVGAYLMSKVPAYDAEHAAQIAGAAQ